MAPRNIIHSSALAGIAETLPASRYAQAQLTQAATAGFKWKKPAHVLGKIREELDEVRDAQAEGDTTHLTAEVGDLLHSVHTLAVYYGVVAEDVLEKACRRPADTTTPDVALQSIDDELVLLEGELELDMKQSIAAQIGNVLKAIHHYAELQTIAPEEALSLTNKEFARRFTGMEAQLQRENKTIPGVIETDGLMHLVSNYWNTQKTSQTGSSRA